MILPMEGDDASGWRPGKPTVFLNSPAVEPSRCSRRTGGGSRTHRTSQDAVKCTCGRSPGPGPSCVSIGGGGNPTWSRTKRELFYGFNGQIMVAAFAVEGDSFRAEKPRLWSEGRYQTRGPNRMFDLHPDGERFALAPAAQTPAVRKQDQVVVHLQLLRGAAPNRADNTVTRAPDRRLRRRDTARRPLPPQVQPHADHHAARDPRRRWADRNG